MARRFASTSFLAGSVLLAVSRCASIVGISDVPYGDGGVVLPGLDGTTFPRPDGMTTLPDGFFLRPDARGGGQEAGHAGFDVVQPAGDAPSPTGDSGGLALTYHPSNVGGMTFAASVTGPLDLTQDNCLIDTDYPEPPQISCSSGMNPSMDIFSVDLPDGAGTAVIYVFTSITIDDQSQLSVTGPNPLILVALGAAEIAGTIDASADIYDENGLKVPGERVTGPGVGGFNNSGPQGGGGGSFCGMGGAGATGAGAIAADSQPGTTYGNAQLVPLWGGSPGGGFNNQVLDDTANGHGGGVIQISAGTTLTVEKGASINVNGSGGVSDGDTSGEGAGSGGGILLEAPTVTVAGVLTANGGEGADGTMDGASPGADGGIATEPGCAGGVGAGGAHAAGGNGVTASGAYGGGGGGAGWIRINGTNVMTPGTLSPSTVTACASIGPLP